MTFMIVALLVGIAVALVLGMQTIPAADYRRRLAEFQRSIPAGALVSITGTTTNGSADITAPSSVAEVQTGMLISGPGVLPGTHVTVVDSNTPKITMSANPGPGAGTGPITFSSPVAIQVHLMKAVPAPGPNPTPASFTEADFDTYAAVTPSVFTGPFTDTSGNAVIIFEASWQLNADPVVANTIYGYWIDYVFPAGSGTRVVACYELFPTPQPMSANGNAIPLSIPYQAPTPGTALLL